MCFFVYRFVSGCVVEFRGRNSVLVRVNVTPEDFYSLFVLYYIYVLVLYHVDMICTNFYFGCDQFGVALVRFVLACGSFRRDTGNLAGCAVSRHVCVQWQI